mmetsp:Transcript_85120/g.182405  ORF Transcript_85120/g.182405 Transcript_85120/m.182405 type:complete len:228 (+) Transcript_85120:541-1224(+)
MPTCPDSPRRSSPSTLRASRPSQLSARSAISSLCAGRVSPLPRAFRTFEAPALGSMPTSHASTYHRRSPSSPSNTSTSIRNLFTSSVRSCGQGSTARRYATISFCCSTEREFCVVATHRTSIPWRRKPVCPRRPSLLFMETSTRLIVAPAQGLAVGARRFSAPRRMPMWRCRQRRCAPRWRPGRWAGAPSLTSTVACASRGLSSSVKIYRRASTTTGLRTSLHVTSS